MNEEALKWQKRFERERASRKEAESLLEGKSLELWELNENLKDRVEEATKELHFTINTLDKYVIMSKTDTNGILTDVSQAFCDISGYSRDELIGQHHSIIRHPDTPTHVFDELWETISHGESWYGELRNRTKSGTTYWVSSTISPNIDDEGNIIGYISVKQDITDSHIVKEQQDQLVSQSRHAAMGEMISMIAHQWRQPLSTISSIAANNIVTIDLDMLDIDQFKTSQNEIIEFSNFLSSTINDFRNFFKPNRQKESLLLKSIIEESLKFSEHMLKNNDILLTMNCEYDVEVLVYKNELVQVLLNIIKNAKDQLDENRVENRQIIISSFKSDSDHHSLSVSDNAGGIPEDILPKIFEPYFSTKSKNGTGLGLYMSKTIIEDHLDGELLAYNNDHGAVFEIRLPVTKES
jgi:PAS domain S-box-containing protein